MSYRKPPIKIAIVDDHKLFRKGLITLIDLAYKQNYLLVFEAESGDDMVKKIDKKALPDILLLDIDMPDMDGFESMVWLKKHHPGISVLVISMVESEESVVRMLRLGVKGYLSKDIEVEDIHQAIKSISEKGYYYTDFITGKLIDAIKQESVEDIEGREGEVDAIWKSLSENERIFIRYACSELKYEEVAEKMFLSPKTIDGYRQAIFNRYGIKNRVGLVLFAIKNGLFNINEI
ncbi:DNA-binding response regulator, NarL/FixJ family, contains REC and HTH domains [Filimonas lacunae]|uniref:DNA-binding response regulator, NarL/FixJ family, contains REC and HTH domains n=1 Tax=Filimonas lacunae TaxID=477680 RepID=A0A173MHW6_9BACT|nr:response regulator transcription factor [Filimonas lacunae]BAV07008.1 two-component response regulator [Filimonas lacunae]SIS96492.1 DNA-binding response regulator, NarL/FixJ family, contains REC and HTH domains [Filimonas lacunae]